MEARPRSEGSICEKLHDFAPKRRTVKILICEAASGEEQRRSDGAELCLWILRKSMTV